jgi:integrase
VQNKKRPKLPRGLRWHSRSKFIWFTWRDVRGAQHQKSTETDDPAKALLFKLQFLEEQQLQTQQPPYVEGPNLKKESLSKVAALYFAWKAASSSATTIDREKRIFKNIERFLGPATKVGAIKVHQIREYQKQRREQISPTMKQFITARTVNYEVQLLRAILTYADCWTGELAARYRPLRQIKRRVGKVASKSQLRNILATAMRNEYWQLAMYCAAVAAGTGCRAGEIRNLKLEDIDLFNGKIRIAREIAKNRKERHPRLMALAEWGLRHLLSRAQILGATEPNHYLLPLSLRKSRYNGRGDQKWDVTKPMTGWVKSWRRLMEACGMAGFRFHDLRHTFRTQGAEAGVPLEVMMAQLGHMDRETSLEYVHIQQRALERAKQLIEAEQTEIMQLAEEHPAPLQGKPAALERSGPTLILDSGVNPAHRH